MNARRLQRGHGRPRARGFILLTVVLALTLVAAVAFLLNRSGGMNMSLAARGLQTDAARYAAEAALAQLNYQTRSLGCSGYTDLGTTAFGAHSFTATVNPKSGSPVTLSATATTADGATATLTRNNVSLYDSTPTTLILQPDADGGIDAWLNNFKVSVNNGANPRLTLNASASVARPLLKFDLSAIPAGSTVSAATLSLYQETSGSVGSSPPNPVYNLHRVTRAWVEGTKMGTGTADGATWNSTDGSAAWTTPGGDFDPAVAASAPANENIDWKTWDVGGLVADWVNGAYPNHGMLLNGVGAISTLGFASSDNGIAANRPKLEVSFLPACAAPAPPAPPGPPVPPGTAVTLAASQDTWIDETGSGAANYGGAPSFTVTNAAKAGRALVRFDLSTVPPGTLLTSATLRLWAGSFSPKADSILTVQKVYDPWVEGSRNGSGSADGATWKTRDGSNAWSAGFGIVTGFDLGVPTAATALPSSFSSGWVEWNVTPLAQRWIDGVSPNYGAGVTIDTASAVIFNSREWTLYQPQLVLTY